MREREREKKVFLLAISDSGAMGDYLHSCIYIRKMNIYCMCASIKYILFVGLVVLSNISRHLLHSFLWASEAQVTGPTQTHRNTENKKESDEEKQDHIRYLQLQ